jgi:four helix bundle protein
MGITRTHKNLLAWREAMTLAEIVYHESATFPREETYGLAAQIRRAAVSIPSNIAEGAARNTSKELLHYLGITCGSVAELETQLELATRLGLLARNSMALSQTDRVGALVRRMRKSLRTRT